MNQGDHRSTPTVTLIPNIVDPVTRLGADRLERAGESVVHYTCPSCSHRTEIGFSTYDYRMAAKLQAGLDDTNFDDTAGLAFDAARPLNPGQRGLDGTCAGCGARYRIIADGGEESREGVLVWNIAAVVELPPFVVAGQAPAAAAATATAPTQLNATGKVVVWLIVLALIAGGLAMVRYGWQQHTRRADLVAVADVAKARVTGETLRHRSTATVAVAFTDAKGGEQTGRVDLPMLSGWHAGDATLSVIYDPRHPTRIETERAGLEAAWLFVLGGVLLIALGFQLIRNTVRRR